jgi:methionine-rich copper-binding protein CopC
VEWARAALLGLCALLMSAAPGRAHSLLIESSPAANATVSTPPNVLVLRFNNRIEKKLSRLRLVRGAGETLDLPVVVTGRADTLSASVPSLSPGAWRVEWQVLSTDGHVVSGTFSFRLAPGPSPSR